MTVRRNNNRHEMSTAIRHLLRWLWGGLAVLAMLFVLAILNNNYSLRRPSRIAFDARLDLALNNAINWIKDNPDTAETSPPMMYMVADMERMSHDPRLKAILDDYQKNYLTHPLVLLDFVWYRLVIRNANAPIIRVPDQKGAMSETVWDAYALAPDTIILAPDDRASMFSPTKHIWGARQHQLLALVIYRDYNGGSPALDSTINHLAQKIARDARYDFRVSDSYVQRTAFVLGAGRPDLIRSRWADRILDNQNANGSWGYCWYGWCRGVFEFSFESISTRSGHSTIQAAWALTMLKYRYPQWIEEHYR
jgi:hypothetical protein